MHRTSETWYHLCLLLNQRNVLLPSSPTVISGTPLVGGLHTGPCLFAPSTDSLVLCARALLVPVIAFAKKY